MQKECLYWDSFYRLTSSLLIHCLFFIRDFWSTGTLLLSSFFLLLHSLSSRSCFLSFPFFLFLGGREVGKRMKKEKETCSLVFSDGWQRKVFISYLVSAEFWDWVLHELVDLFFVNSTQRWWQVELNRVAGRLARVKGTSMTTSKSSHTLKAVSLADLQPNYFSKPQHIHLTGGRHWISCFFSFFCKTWNS